MLVCTDRVQRPGQNCPWIIQTDWPHDITGFHSGEEQAAFPGPGSVLQREIKMVFCVQ